MSRVMLLVGATGATMAETRVDAEPPEDDKAAKSKLREEARVSGFGEDEVRAGRFVLAGDPPFQP